LYLTFSLSGVEARAIISTGDEMSIFDLPGKVFSPKRKDDSSNLYAGLVVKNRKTVIRIYALVSDGALSHLMRKMGINLIVRLISGN